MGTGSRALRPDQEAALLTAAADRRYKELSVLRHCGRGAQHGHALARNQNFALAAGGPNQSKPHGGEE